MGIRTEQVPRIPEAERLEIDDLGYEHDGIVCVTARYGFQERLDVPDLLRRAAAERRLERRVDVASAACFISRITIVPTRRPGMARWRKRLFVAMARNASSPVDYFHLPVTAP